MEQFELDFSIFAKILAQYLSVTAIGEVEMNTRAVIYEIIEFTQISAFVILFSRNARRVSAFNDTSQGWHADIAFYTTDGFLC